MCRKCWWKIETFHEFYGRIEAIHKHLVDGENIFVENINVIVKEDTIKEQDLEKIKLDSYSNQNDQEVGGSEFDFVQNYSDNEDNDGAYLIAHRKRLY